MKPDPLPREWIDFEERLARRLMPEPSAGFRARVVAAMASAGSSTVAPRSTWRRLWPAAAAIVVALNLVMCAANGVRYQQLSMLTEHHPAPPGVPQGADAFESMAASALASMRPAPDAGSFGRDFFRNEETRLWATP